MTTIEQRNCSQSLPRPTDLSLKTNFNSKYCSHSTLSEGDNKRHVIVHTPPAPAELYKEQPCKSESTDWKKHAAASPIALVFGGANLTTVTTMATTPALDSAARLVVLDSLFSRQSETRCSSHPVFDVSTKRSRFDSESSSDGGGRTSSGSSPNVVYTPTTEKQSLPKSRSPISTIPTTPTATRGRGTKRKGGWKFHDLSDESDGLGRRKRAYTNNRLENEILMLYQDRICIKEIPNSASAKNTDRLVVIEPSYITDPDLVKYSTGLRLVLNKKRGTYQLQVLPYTIEQGSLSSKSSIMSAVEKLLGDNGSVLCPGIARAILTPQSYLPRQALDTSSNGEQPKPHPISPTRPSSRRGALSSSDAMHDTEVPGDRYWGRWKVFNQFTGNYDHKTKSSTKESNRDETGTTPITPTDRLLLSLNKELSKNQQRQTAQAKLDSSSSANRCLLWHVPTMGGKGNKALWPTEAKWCVNCQRKMNNGK